MKIFIQDSKLSPTVKIIKEEKISQYCWNVIIHTFELKNRTVLYSLEKYNEISDTFKMSLTQPADYVLYGNYYETSYYQLKYKQAQYVGIKVLITIVHKEIIDRNEMIRAWASTRELSESTVCSIIQSCGWEFQTVKEKEFTNYKPTAECSKKVEIKIDSKPKEAMTSHTKLVDRILYDEEQRIVIVFFVDGTKIVKKCHAEDNFDVCVGVSLCITKYLFGNNTTHFIKFVNRKKKKLINKEGAEEQQPKAD